MLREISFPIDACFRPRTNGCNYFIQLRLTLLRWFDMWPSNSSVVEWKFCIRHYLQENQWMQAKFVGNILQLVRPCNLHLLQGCLIHRYLHLAKGQYLFSEIFVVVYVDTGREKNSAYLSTCYLLTCSAYSWKTINTVRLECFFFLVIGRINDKLTKTSVSLKWLKNNVDSHGSQFTGSKNNWTCGERVWLHHPRNNFLIFSPLSLKLN